MPGLLCSDFSERDQKGELHYGSAVSWQLVTKINEVEIMVGLFVVLVGLGGVFWYFGREET